MGAWIGYGSGEPTSYGYGENVYYEGDQVYYGDQAVATADQYAEQADAIAASAAQTNPESSEWLPLGVFALTQDNQATGVEPTLFLQLAISKEGVISGTFKNMATGQVQTLEGMADKKSQRSPGASRGSSGPSWRRGSPTSRRIPSRRSSTLPTARRSSGSWCGFRNRSKGEQRELAFRSKIDLLAFLSPTSGLSASCTARVAT